MTTARSLNTSSVDPLNFSIHALTDSASILAWAGSYTPQGRSQWACAVGGGLIRSRDDNRRSTMRMGGSPSCKVQSMGLAHLTQRRQSVIRGRHARARGPLPSVAAMTALTVSTALAVTVVVLRPRRVVV